MNTLNPDTTLFREYDGNQNAIAMDNFGVHLKLRHRNKGHYRRIMTRNGNLLTKIVPRQNIMRKDNTVGFCLEALVLLQEHKFTHITMIVEDYGTFILSIKDILDKGKPNQYAEQGFEKQIFYPLGG